jgi:DNA-binding MarR family transcriptional regulator
MEMPDHKHEPRDCNCFAIRQAARHVTQFYDQHLAPIGLTTSQWSMLMKIKALGPMTINKLAAELVMDRTTLGRNILPLERDGLIEIRPDVTDRRAKEMHLTLAGAEKIRAGIKLWAAAQAKFEGAYGAKRSSNLRLLLRTLVATELGPGEAAKQGAQRSTATDRRNAPDLRA